MDVNTVNHATVGNLFMLGAGGLVVVALAAYFGRLPTLFHFTLLGFLTAVWCAAANTFNSFLAARILNGFFATVAQGVIAPTPAFRYWNIRALTTASREG